MSARAEARARRKEELLLLGRIERIELGLHVRELRRLKKPLDFAAIGARVFHEWRRPAWVTTAVALLAARGISGGRWLKALRYAGYGYAAWRTYRLVRQYAGSRPAPTVGAAVDM